MQKFVKQFGIGTMMALTLISSKVAFAGDKGNGGGIHFCEGKETLELYDIYEGRTRYGLEFYKDGNESVQYYLDQAIEKISKRNMNIALGVQKILKDFDKNRSFKVLDSINIAASDDANILVVDQGCEYKQIANWVDDVSSIVLVKSEFYNNLSNFDKAGLKLHEAVYAYGRNNFRHTNSDYARRFTAEVLSESSTLAGIKYFEQTRDMTIDKESNRDVLSYKSTYEGRYLEVKLSPFANLENIHNLEFRIDCSVKEGMNLLDLEIIRTKKELVELEKKASGINQIFYKKKLEEKGDHLWNLTTMKGNADKCAAKKSMKLIDLMKLLNKNAESPTWISLDHNEGVEFDFTNSAGNPYGSGTAAGFNLIHNLKLIEDGKVIEEKNIEWKNIANTHVKINLKLQN